MRVVRARSGQLMRISTFETENSCPGECHGSVIHAVRLIACVAMVIAMLAALALPAPASQVPQPGETSGLPSAVPSQLSVPRLTAEVLGPTMIRLIADTSPGERVYEIEV